MIRQSKCTDVHQRETSWNEDAKCECTGTHRHAHVDASNTIEKEEQTGTWVRQVARAMQVQLRKDQQELKTREQMKKSKAAKRIGGIVHETCKHTRTSHVQNEMGRLMHHDEQELLSLWEGMQDAREARVTRANAAIGSAESCVVRDRHGHAWRKGCGAG